MIKTSHGRSFDKFYIKKQLCKKILRIDYESYLLSISIVTTSKGCKGRIL